MVTFEVFSKEGRIILNRKNAICFVDIKSHYPLLKEGAFVDYSIQFISNEISDWFLGGLDSIGLGGIKREITPNSIVVRVPWEGIGKYPKMLSILTAHRYLEEFYKNVNWMHENRNAGVSFLSLFQLSHYFVPPTNYGHAFLGGGTYLSMNIPFLISLEDFKNNLNTLTENIIETGLPLTTQWNSGVNSMFFTPKRINLLEMKNKKNYPKIQNLIKNGTLSEVVEMFTFKN